MKIKFTSGLIVNVTIGLAIGFTLLTWALLMFPDTTTNKGAFDDDQTITIIDNLPPIMPSVSDSIPYYQHKRLQDSIMQLRTLRNGDGPSVGSGVFTALWGTHESNYCDTCTIHFQKGTSPSAFPIYDKPTRNYFILFGWKIKPNPVFGLDSVKFHVEHGQAYIRKQLVDSLHKNDNGTTEKIARLRDIAIPFAYNRQFNCIMVPIEPATKNLIDRVLTIAGILVGIYFMFFIVGGFIKFLIDVSRGRTFTLKNIRRLKIIGISLIAIEALTLLINFCMPLIFHRYFTADVVLNEKSWADSWKILIAGIAFLLLYKAFRNGKKIKDEQDLVI